MPAIIIIAQLLTINNANSITLVVTAVLMVILATGFLVAITVSSKHILHQQFLYWPFRYYYYPIMFTLRCVFETPTHHRACHLAVNTNYFFNQGTPFSTQKNC